ncbi:MAG: DNA primase [Oscillospiraceae bacterium]|nr:DNA primase [Oscillospiraceae bacterium]
MAFSESFLQELIERSDIVDVVGSYVRFTKKSGANQFGLCPFHSEKTPSFSVTADKQIYHCFGCGKGGGVINFIMDAEGLSFRDAVEFLAKRAGMPMPEEENSGDAQRRRRLLEANRDAAKFFRSCLTSPQGLPAAEYMAERQISPSTATRFGLGYAPDTWDGLREHLKSKGYSESELFDAGLLSRGRKGNFFDTYRNRLMFPVIDVRGDVIGFSGRALGDGEPKYLNSRETLVFNKSRNLFAMNLAKKSKSGYIILAEGNIDVVMMHQAGFDSAVASLGTSLTPEQARLISRYTGEVVIAYDADSAGQKASQRAIGILEKLDVKVRVLSMSGAKDPDEYIKKRGADAFRNLVEGSKNHIDFRLQSIEDKYDLSVDEQKVQYLKDATDMLAQLSGAMERQVYAMRVASKAGLSAELVQQEVERSRKRILRSAQRRQDRELSQPIKQLQPADKEYRYDDPESAAAEEGIIRLLFLDQGLFRGRELPEPGEFTSPVLAKIYGVLKEKAEHGGIISTATVSAVLEPGESALLASILQKPELLRNGQQALGDYISRIRKQKELAAEETDLIALANKFKETKGYGG